MEIYHPPRSNSSQEEFLIITAGYWIEILKMQIEVAEVLRFLEVQFLSIHQQSHTTDDIPQLH